MRHILFASLGICGLVACGESGSGGVDADDAPVNCAEVTGVDTFTVGLDKTGDGNVLDFKIMQATPAPPARNDNAWVVQLNAISGGAPVDGATISVTPFMPAHQHGAGKTVKIMPMPTAGQYNLSPINLWMPGVWETTIDVTSAAGSDKVVFKFCIPS